MGLTIRKALYSIFFPHICVMCGKYIGSDTDSVICDACQRTLPRTEQAQYDQNGTEMELLKVDPMRTRDTAAAMLHLKHIMHLNRAAAFLFYETGSPVQQMVHKMKYADRPEIGYQLGRMAALEFQYADFFDGIDIIIPIPLHPKRLRERGYNQSEYIARGISEITGIPIDTTHVIRSRNTPKQALQRGEQRLTNIAGAFEVNHPEQLYHKHILLVDDVITTGETMRSCLSVMKRFRGATFTVFALCKAR